MRWLRTQFCVTALGWLLVLALSGCVSSGPRDPDAPVEPVRVSQALGSGDAVRDASLRLVLQGLDADSAGRLERAQGSYERAIQVDPTNPFAYLALARHRLDVGDPDGALDLIEQAAALFEAEDMRDPTVGVHLIGLRGRVHHATGRGEDGVLYLERARQLAPDVWGDGYLAPEELR